MLRLSDDDRRGLAVLGKEIGRRLFDEFATLVTPDPIVRWHPQLVARNWTNKAGVGRPGATKAIDDLAVRMAKDNPSRGYRRIEGALRNLGHRASYNAVKRILKAKGIEPDVLPVRSPNLNAFAVRFVRTIKSECLSKLILFGQASLDRAILEFALHYHTERNHQGLDNKLITKATMPVEGEVVRDERLGGLLSFYHRAA